MRVVTFDQVRQWAAREEFGTSHAPELIDTFKSMALQASADNVCFITFATTKGGPGLQRYEASLAQQVPRSQVEEYSGCISAENACEFLEMGLGVMQKLLREVSEQNELVIAAIWLSGGRCRLSLTG